MTEGSGSGRGRTRSEADLATQIQVTKEFEEHRTRSEAHRKSIDARLDDQDLALKEIGIRLDQLTETVGYPPRFVNNRIVEGKGLHALAVDLKEQMGNAPELNFGEGGDVTALKPGRGVRGDLALLVLAQRDAKKLAEDQKRLQEEAEAKSDRRWKLGSRIALIVGTIVSLLTILHYAKVV